MPFTIIKPPPIVTLVIDRNEHGIMISPPIIILFLEDSLGVTTTHVSLPETRKPPLNPATSKDSPDNTKHLGVTVTVIESVFVTMRK